MPRSFYEPEEHQDTSACGKLRDDLKYCLQQTDCFKKVFYNFFCVDKI